MESLRERLVAGDPDAFADLYDAVADQVFHYLVTQTGSRDDAADLLQESITRVYRYRKRLANVENLPAYVFRIARNEVMRWRRRHTPTLASAKLLFKTADDSTESVLETNELIVMAMNRLSDNCREVIELKAFGKLTFAEIAAVMGKPPGTVATWYRRALDQMRRSLKNEVEQ